MILELAKIIQFTCSFTPLISKIVLHIIKSQRAENSKLFTLIKSLNAQLSNKISICTSSILKLYHIVKYCLMYYTIRIDNFHPFETIKFYVSPAPTPTPTPLTTFTQNQVLQANNRGDIQTEMGFDRPVTKPVPAKTKSRNAFKTSTFQRS